MNPPSILVKESAEYIITQIKQFANLNKIEETHIQQTIEIEILRNLIDIRQNERMKG